MVFLTKIAVPKTILPGSVVAAQGNFLIWAKFYPYKVILSKLVDPTTTLLPGEGDVSTEVPGNTRHNTQATQDTLRLSGGLNSSVPRLPLLDSMDTQVGHRD